MLTIAVDVKSPECYLALGPTARLQEELGLAFSWQPYISPPLRVPQEAPPGADRGARHRAFRSHNHVRDILRYAAVQGLEMNDIYRSPDSTLVAIGLLWVNQQAPGAASEYLQRAFEGYWQRNLDIESADAVRALLAQVAGGGVAGFDEYARAGGHRDLEEQRRQLREGGVSRAPAYLLDDELYFGRQHLPMIRWMLTGQAGPAPL